ncbi:hypothetical protein AG0111_0g3277 [Alternaria gaisen]|uniref:Uncharacterized protein n=1 Tax=Alternaria gaisen TaxID=167740 RepID=A0ACB6FW73_9PLEO|nr:hypothetical protein AG0111_0g3277 [Alternaria gaisen]
MRGNVDLPVKKISPARAKKEISAATVFKRQNNKIEQRNSTIQATLRNSKFTGEDANATTLLSAKSRSSPRSIKKSGGKKRSSERHPLNVVFKDASDEYRRHLYNTTSLNITKTLNSLLHNLYDSTLRTITPDGSQQNSNASPLRLSGPAKYERLGTQLYQPISQFKLSLWRIDSRGKSVRFVQTLETRMLHYDELIAKETKKLGTLQKEWESVVSKIWKLGATCLGDEAMAEMLFTEQGLYEKTLPLSSSPFKATDAEDTLFIPENDSFSPRYKPLVGKRRITFLEEEEEEEEEEEAPGVCDEYDATPTDQFPDFIHQPSSDRNGTLPLIPDLSEGETKGLEKMVKELGKQEMGDFCKIEEDHEAYWKKKTAQLANALKSV